MSIGEVRRILLKAKEGLFSKYTAGKISTKRRLKSLAKKVQGKKKMTQ